MAEKADALVLDLFGHRCALAGIKKHVDLCSLSLQGCKQGQIRVTYLWADGMFMVRGPPAIEYSSSV